LNLAPGTLWIGGGAAANLRPMDTSPAHDPTDRALYPDWTRVTIRYADVDPNDHVNNGAINQFFEDGRVALRQKHLSGLAEGILAGFALVKFTATYRATLHYPGEVEVGTRVIRVGRSSYELGQAVFQDGRCAATAEVVTVKIEPGQGRSSPLPEPVREILEKLRAGTG